LAKTLHSYFLITATYKNNAEYSIEAAITALAGGFDYSYGANRWDGVDLAEYGFNQYKCKYAGFEISAAHFYLRHL
jgi:hypothetical protein